MEPGAGAQPQTGGEDIGTHSHCGVTRHGGEGLSGGWGMAQAGIWQIGTAMLLHHCLAKVAASCHTATNCSNSHVGVIVNAIKAVAKIRNFHYT